MSQSNLDRSHGDGMHSSYISTLQCRSFMPSRQTKFRLEVHSTSSADVTVWLPSDFKGHIHRSSSCRKVSFSAGFTNRIMKNVCLTQSRRPSVVSTSSGVPRYSDIYISDVDPYQMEKLGGLEEDEVIVDTSGSVTFRMWDIHRGEPEARCKEACKRMFGFGWCAKRNNEVEIDWDFLLEDWHFSSFAYTYVYLFSLTCSFIAIFYSFSSFSSYHYPYLACFSSITFNDL